LNFPQNLFAYGDVDGERYEAKLQHPLGVAYHYQPQTDKQFVFVVDTYNHKIKRIDLETNVIQTLPVVDKNGQPFAFNEPSDLCSTANGEHLIVVDTNNHRLVKVELFSFEAEEFELNWDSPVEKEEEILDGVLTTDPVEVSLLVGGVPADQVSFKIRVNYSLLNDIHGTPGAKNKSFTKFSQTTGITQTNSEIFLDGSAGHQDLEFKVHIPELTDLTISNKSILFLCQYDTCFKREIELKIPVKFVRAPRKNEIAVDVVVAKYNIAFKGKETAGAEGDVKDFNKFDPQSELFDLY
jgi:hypothetical protein